MRRRKKDSRGNQIVQIKGLLNMARNLQNVEILETVKETLKKIKAKPEEIGTSEKEFGELAVKFYLNKAMAHRNGARNLVDVNYNLDWMKIYLEKAKKRPEDIGITEKEISELSKKELLFFAKESFESAKKRVGTRVHELALMRNFLEKAKASLVDIGTSEDEIKRLLRDGYIRQARIYLNEARKGINPELAIEHLMLNLQRANANFKEIGTNEKEIGELENKS